MTAKRQKGKAEECLEMINLILQQHDCMLKADFIVSEFGIKPRIFVIENESEEEETGANPEDNKDLQEQVSTQADSSGKEVQE